MPRGRSPTKIVVLRGSAGSGKTSVARALSGQPPWEWAAVVIDAIRPTFEVPADLDDDAQYRLLVGEVGVQTALRRKQGRNVIVDSDFQNEEHLRRFLTAVGLDRTSQDLLLVRLTVQVSAAVDRAANRSEVPLKPERTRQLHDLWTPKPVVGEVVVPTDGVSLADVVYAVQAAIERRWTSSSDGVD